MSAAPLLVVAWAAPLLASLCMLLPSRTLRSVAVALAPMTMVPALLVAFGQRELNIDASQLLLGVSLSCADSTTRIFLLFTGALWLASSFYARTYLANDPRRDRFWAFFLASASGNIGLIVAEDPATFYLFFSLMTFAAYGLIVHDGTADARRAARIYLAMGFVGEMLLLSAFVLVVGADINVRIADVPALIAASDHCAVVSALLIAGFGIKAGMLLLHVWLPLAHPVAPTPASAVLSGAMIKAGLLGWLRFLPLGLVAQPGLGAVCVVAGIAATVFAAAVGLTQREPKTILAYSSVSQMGFATAAVGIGLAVEGSGPVVIGALLFFAIHHGLAKGALFLAVGVAAQATRGWSRRLVAVGLALPALDLAGSPLSSGALAKLSLKDVVALAPWHRDTLLLALTLAAVGSAILMVHFLLRMTSSGAKTATRPSVGLWLPWALLLVVDAAVLFLPPVAEWEVGVLLKPTKVWEAAWPVALGVALVGCLGWMGRRVNLRWERQLPPGDVLVLFTALVERVKPLGVRCSAWNASASSRRVFEWLGRFARFTSTSSRRVEGRLGMFETVGTLFFLLLLALMGAAWLSSA